MRCWAGRRTATTAIGLYLEEVRDPDAFFPLAGRVARDKPIVVLKPGRTPAGAVAKAPVPSKQVRART